jgi:glyoxalase family protein
MLLGFHHVTAIAGDPQRNLDFYAGFLGMRLVKRTVNLDDPGTHHFHYGNREGAPGTLLTFFAWAGSHRRAQKGAGQVAAVAFEAAGLERWKRRAAADRRP